MLFRVSGCAGFWGALPVLGWFLMFFGFLSSVFRVLGVFWGSFVGFWGILWFCGILGWVGFGVVLGLRGFGWFWVVCSWCGLGFVWVLGLDFRGLIWWCVRVGLFWLGVVSLSGFALVGFGFSVGLFRVVSSQDFGGFSDLFSCLAAIFAFVWCFVCFIVFEFFVGLIAVVV